MQLLQKPSKLPKSSSSFPSSSSSSPSRIWTLIAISISLCIIFLIINLLLIYPTKLTTLNHISPETIHSPTTLRHIVFGIASGKNSWPRRQHQLLRWWTLNQTRGCVFLDELPDTQSQPQPPPPPSPPICISGDTSAFRYTFHGGPRSAIRVARVVLETVNLHRSHHGVVRWFVFGDDDTLFFTKNLVKTLAKYDHRQWYYIGGNSEIYEQNNEASFDMAFGGGGFAISAPLAEALAKVFDQCIERYPHLYGSDHRIHSCIAELGIGLTREPGFHQLDVRGDAHGLLAAHPLSPSVSLHHIDHLDPLIPNQTKDESLDRLFKAAELDSERMFQQTVCYDRWFSWTISVSWGYVVQVIPQHVPLSEAVKAQETFRPWKKSNSVLASVYTFNIRPFHPDVCKRATNFFMESVSRKAADGVVIESVYKKHVDNNCTRVSGTPRQLEQIRVKSTKLNLDYRQVNRRQCCDVLPSSVATEVEVSIRECKEDELIYLP